MLYVTLDNKKYGPVDLKQFLKYCANGEVLSETHVINEKGQQIELYKFLTDSSTFNLKGLNSRKVYFRVKGHKILIEIINEFIDLNPACILLEKLETLCELPLLNNPSVAKSSNSLPHVIPKYFQGFLDSNKIHGNFWRGFFTFLFFVFFSLFLYVFIYALLIRLIHTSLLTNNILFGVLLSVLVFRFYLLVFIKNIIDYLNNARVAARDARDEVARQRALEVSHAYVDNTNVAASPGALRQAYDGLEEFPITRFILLTFVLPAIIALPFMIIGISNGTYNNGMNDNKAGDEWRKNYNYSQDALKKMQAGEFYKITPKERDGFEKHYHLTPNELRQAADAYNGE
jgi:hypothetical protein